MRTQDLNFFAFKVDFRIVICIQKISAAQMVVAFHFTGPDAAGLNLSVNRRSQWILGVKIECAVNIFKKNARAHR